MSTAQRSGRRPFKSGPSKSKPFRPRAAGQPGSKPGLAGKKPKSASRKHGSTQPGGRPARPRRGVSEVRTEPAASDSLQRLQKVMAACGINSRRHCEEMILAGRVEVDGVVVQELGTRVDPSKQEIRVDGASLKPARPVYYLVNKPVGVVTTNYDQDGRQRVIDLVPPADHLFAVGRLDRSSEGLILVTNDGALANRLAHPRFGVEKCYRVVVLGSPELASLQRLRDGVYLAEGQVQVADLKVHQRLKKTTVLEMVLTEGRNREIRRMLARIGHKVLELRRVSFGPLRIGNMPAGAYRPLSPPEVRALQRYRPSPVKRNDRPRRSAKMTHAIGESPSDARQTGPKRAENDVAKRGKVPAKSGRVTVGRPTDRSDRSSRPATGRPATGRPATAGRSGKAGARRPITVRAGGKPTGSKSGGGPKSNQRRGKRS